MTKWTLDPDRHRIAPDGAKGAPLSEWTDAKLDAEFERLVIVRDAAQASLSAINAERHRRTAEEVDALRASLAQFPSA